MGIGCLSVLVEYLPRLQLTVNNNSSTSYLSPPHFIVKAFSKIVDDKPFTVAPRLRGGLILLTSVRIRRRNTHQGNPVTKLKSIHGSSSVLILDSDRSYWEMMDGPCSFDNQI